MPVSASANHTSISGGAYTGWLARSSSSSRAACACAASGAPAAPSCAVGRAPGGLEARAVERFLRGDPVALQFPVHAAVTGRDDHAVVPDGPARGGVGEPHRREQHRHRDARLRPGPARVVGIEHVATVADRDQPVAGARNVEEQRVLRTWQHERGFGSRDGSLRRTSQQPRAERREKKRGTRGNQPEHPDHVVLSGRTITLDSMRADRRRA